MHRSATFGLTLALLAAPLLASAQPAAPAPAPGRPAGAPGAGGPGAGGPGRGAAAAGAEAPHVAPGTGVWVHVPSAAEIAAVYPAAAKAAGKGGTVSLHCTATATGGLDTCRVNTETPTGLGLGDAAMKLVPLFKLALKSSEGVDVAGARIAAPDIVFPAP